MTYRTEFPDFPEADMPPLPAGFADESWHNDAMPHFDSARLRMSIWIDYADPAMRETPNESARYTVYDVDYDGDNNEEQMSTDDWQLVLAYVADRTAVADLIEHSGYHFIEDAEPRVGPMFHVMKGDQRIAIKYSRLEAEDFMVAHAKGKAR